MKKALLHFFILMNAVNAYSAIKTYTALAIDSNGLVCVGSWGTNIGGGFVCALSSECSSNSIACTNGSMRVLPDGHNELQFVNQIISPRPNQFIALGSFVAAIEVAEDSITIQKSECLCYENHSGFNPYFNFCRSIVSSNGDDYYVYGPRIYGEYSLKNLSGWSNFWSENDYGNVWTTVYDFKGVLWGGDDTSAYIQEGDSFTYYNVGWPVRTITPVDSDIVVIKSFDPAFDDLYYQSPPPMHYKGCIHRETGYDPDCLNSGFPASLYGKLYCPRPGYCFDGRDRIVNGVRMGSAQIPTDHVFNSQLDPSGTLWMTTLNGLYSVDTATLEATRHYIGHDQPTPIQSRPLNNPSILKASALNSSILVHQAPTSGTLRLINSLGKVSATQKLSVQASGFFTMGQNLKAGVWTLLWTHGQQRLSKQVVVY